MGQHSERAREHLLDAAEKLFASEGIDAVSNRRIAEQAGNANHSAVKYHFGGREELLRAITARGRENVNERRAALQAELGPEPNLRAVITIGILPWVDYLDSLPVPSWRARFLAQASTSPVLGEIIRDYVLDAHDFGGLLRNDLPELAAIPQPIIEARSRILAQLILGLAAEHEARLAAGTSEGTWHSFGHFLTDAAVGMLAAEVTQPGNFE